MAAAAASHSMDCNVAGNRVRKLCQSPRNVPSSEDCLFLNVWRPADTTSSLPVLVHIHGGGFFGGSGNGDNTLLATTGHEVIFSMKRDDLRRIRRRIKRV
jgi:carboxylesterase type B